jgi:uncharacterized Zn finger protein
VSAAERRRKANLEIDKSRKKGAQMQPVVIRGRAIAATFWGKAWCDNIERYSDYSNRLPRGRTYVRNRSVIDLRITAGKVAARVMGSDLYAVEVKVAALPQTRWNAVCKACAGAIDSLVELLQGRFSQSVMERVCQPGSGLFPSPKEITFTCSCPDWASMCKHVAAVLYGIGARLDEKPELLFELRKVDEKDLIAAAGKELPLAGKGRKTGKVLETGELANIFGIEMAATTEPPVAKTLRKAKRKPPTASAGKKGTAKKTTAKKSTAKKSTGKKSTGKKITGKKITAKRNSATKPIGKKGGKARSTGGAPNPHRRTKPTGPR